MLARCFNPNDGHFSGYGARGITACDRWNDFANFLADMGERPAADAVEVERLQRLMQKIMARCADLLDEDQFNELDAVARATDPTDVARQIAEGPCCDECGKSKRDGWALYCVACLERVLTPDPTSEAVGAKLYRLEDKLDKYRFMDFDARDWNLIVVPACLKHDGICATHYPNACPTSGGA